MPTTAQKLAKPTLLHTPSDLDETGRAKLSDSLNLLVACISKPKTTTGT
jgi:hypothetical protein